MPKFMIQQLNMCKSASIDHIEVHAPTAEEARRLVRDHDGVVGEEIHYVGVTTVDVGQECTTTIIGCKSI